MKYMNEQTHMDNNAVSIMQFYQTNIQVYSLEMTALSHDGIGWQNAIYS